MPWSLQSGLHGNGSHFPAFRGPRVPLLLGQPCPAMSGPERHQETEGLLGARGMSTVSPELSLLCSRQRTQPWPRPMRTSGRRTNAAWTRYWRAQPHTWYTCGTHVHMRVPGHEAVRTRAPHPRPLLCSPGCQPRGAGTSQPEGGWQEGGRVLGGCEDVEGLGGSWLIPHTLTRTCARSASS